MIRNTIPYVSSTRITLIVTFSSGGLVDPALGPEWAWGMLWKLSFSAFACLAAFGFMARAARVSKVFNSSFRVLRVWGNKGLRAESLRLEGA